MRPIVALSIQKERIRSMFPTRPLWAAAAALLCSTACAALAPAAAWSEPVVVRGEVIHRERIAIPSGATVSVRIEDSARRVLAALVFATGGKQSPFPFAASYYSEAVKGEGPLTVSASIAAGGRTLFEGQNKFTGSSDGAVEVLVTRPADAAADIAGKCSFRA